MTRSDLALNLWTTVRSHWRVMLGVLPGLALVSLHSTALALPKADFIDALDSDHYRIQWITGAYLLGSAVGMALTRYVGERIGLRRAFLLALAVFTTAAGACAAVSAVPALAPLRLLQGLGNGLLISTGMVLVWRAFPVHKEFAMAVYGMAVFVPALAGAPFGGLLTTWVSWRLIFLINVPLGGLLALLAARMLPPDVPASQPGPFDWIGLALLVAWIVPLNVVLDLGQYWGWLGSPYFVPWFAALVVATVVFAAWGVWAPAPLINFRPLAIRPFALGLCIKVLFGINLFALAGLLSGYQINVRGYQWWQGSLVMLPALATMLLSILVGSSLGHDANRKARMFLGLAVMAVATWQFAAVDVYTAKAWQALHLALWGVGAGLVVGPALLTAFEGLSPKQALETAGIFNLLRSLPTFIAVGLLSTLLTQRTDTNFDWLRQSVRHNRPIVARSLHVPERHFVQRGSSPRVATAQAHAALGRWVHVNARAFALRDLFQFLALVPAVGLILVLLVRIPSGRSRLSD